MTFQGGRSQIDAVQGRPDQTDELVWFSVLRMLFGTFGPGCCYTKYTIIAMILPISVPVCNTDSMTCYDVWDATHVLEETPSSHTQIRRQYAILHPRTSTINSKQKNKIHTLRRFKTHSTQNRPRRTDECRRLLIAARGRAKYSGGELRVQRLILMVIARTAVPDI